MDRLQETYDLLVKAKAYLATEPDSMIKYGYIESILEVVYMRLSNEIKERANNEQQ